jgi:signal transduction histidine kinase
VVVKSHGGKLRFESEMGRGTTFYVHLPIRRADDPENEALAAD